MGKKTEDLSAVLSLHNMPQFSIRHCSNSLDTNSSKSGFFVNFLGAVHMIPEWVSFRNEFRSRMKFVLHSHDKIDQLSHLENDRFVRHLENDTPASLAQDYTVCGFISERSSFSVYMIPEWNVTPEREFHSDWKPEWIHSGMTCAGTKFRLGIM